MRPGARAAGAAGGRRGGNGGGAAGAGAGGRHRRTRESGRGSRDRRRRSGAGARESGRIGGGALLLGGATAVVLVVLGVAFSVMDSPAEQRRQRLDAQRVEDLQDLAHAVDHYWTHESVLPPDLDTLDGWEAGDLPTADPVSGEPYTYRPTGRSTDEGHYELCATFDTDTPEEEHTRTRRTWVRHEGWHHGPGEHCFERTARELEHDRHVR